MIPMPPLSPFNLFAIVGQVVKVIKAFFTPPKPKESPEDVMERQKDFNLFCDQVHQEASRMERYVVQQLEDYGSYLNAMSKSEAYSILSRYHVNTRSLLSQLEVLKMQIPGIIRGEVASHLSAGDGECMKIQKMLPGVEKEAQMKRYFESIISAALEKCANTTQSIMTQMQDIFVDDLQGCLDASRQQLEGIERGLAGFTETADEAVERVRVRTDAEHIIRCSKLISELFD